MLKNTSIAGRVRRNLSELSTNRMPALKRWLPATALILSLGCTANGEPAVEVTLDNDFHLRAGQSARIAAENIEIRFVGVTGDSRCPKGVMCVWEGDALVRIEILVGNEKEERTLHTASREANATDFANLNVGLIALHPAAVEGQVIEPEAYVAILRVARGMSGGKIVN